MTSPDVRHGLPSIGEARVFQVVSALPTDELLAQLPTDERVAGSRRHDGGRQFALGRLAIRQLIEAATVGGGGAVNVTTWCPSCHGTDHGAPAVDARHEVSFSVAHSGRHVLIAVAGGRPDDGTMIGVDVEDPSRRARDVPVSATFFHRDEIVRIGRSGSAADKQRELLRLWCRKEAAMKAVGLGLRGGMSKHSAICDTVIVDRGAGATPVELSVHDVAIEGAFAAIAVPPDSSVSALGCIVVEAANFGEHHGMRLAADVGQCTE